MSGFTMADVAGLKISRLASERERAKAERDARQERLRAEAELACKTRGQAHTSKSGRPFRTAIAAEPERNGKHLNGTQLLLDLCACSGRTARAPRQLSQEAARAAADRRGQAALELLDKAHAAARKALAESAYFEGGEMKYRPSMRSGLEFYYWSEGGELLVTTLRGLTGDQYSECNRVNLDHKKGPRIITSKQAKEARRVVWPSQSTVEPLRIDHE